MSIQLQPGKWYRQRDGGKAYVAAHNPDAYEHNQFIGWESQGFVCGWHADGRHYKGGPDSYSDLVTEWVDEPTDAEIAEMFRWCCENSIGVNANGVVFNVIPRSKLTARKAVDAVNEYRQREGA